MKELYNPRENWKEIIHNTKYTIDPILRKPKFSYTFTLEQDDNIKLDDKSFYFKRSHFYKKFFNQQSRIKQDLINYYLPKGYFVLLFFDEEHNKWCLKLSWNDQKISDP